MERRRAMTVAAAVACAVLLMAWGAFSAIHTSEAHRAREKASAHANTAAEAVNRQLTRTLSATSTLASMIELNPDATMERFDPIATNLMERFGGLDALSLAPGGVHTHIAPLDTYRSVLGVDLFADPARRAGALESIATGDLSVSGPLPVIGGGTGFFVRLPVYVPEGSDTFWGFVIGVVEIGSLLDEAGTGQLEADGYAFRFDQVAPDGTTTRIAGTGRELTDPVTSSFAVPGAAWRLSLTPRGGWDDGPLRPLESILLVLLAGTVGFAVLRLLGQPVRLQEQVDRRTQELQTALLDAWLQRREVADAQEQLATIVSRSPDAVVAGTAQGIITEWNEAAEGLFGWSRPEILGRPVAVLIPPSGQAALIRHGDALARGELVRVVEPRIRKDGSSFQAELILSGNVDEHGTVRHWIAIARDVTMQRFVGRAQEAIRSSLHVEESLTALVRAMRSEIELDQLGLVEVDGARASRTRLVDVDGVPDPTPHARTLVLSAVGRVIGTGRTARVVDGDRWAIALPIRQHGQLMAVLSISGLGASPPEGMLTLLGEVADGIGQDVANMLLYQRQAETARKLRELDELKSDFLSTVSHELRTPLTAIAGFAATLDERWSELNQGMRRNLVRRVLAKSRHLDELIGELLDFSRLESGRLEVDLRPCDLRAEVRRELAKLDAVLRDHLVEIHIDDGIVVLADPHGLARVMENLLSNAAKFSPEGETITIGASEVGDEVVVRISDRGIGIPEAEQDRIFERFYRVNRGDRVQAHGTGIGLAIVKQFVEAQGGRVWVERPSGGGSTFLFTLPRGRRSGDRATVDITSAAASEDASRAGRADAPFAEANTAAVHPLDERRRRA